ncbi:MAG: Pyruvate synthase subunit PorC [Candidatus Methanogaster sp.]|nr:MAG: Pyruvate synthase subunit PorC [ANME-2 cluster archaeon]
MELCTRVDQSQARLLLSGEWWDLSMLEITIHGRGGQGVVVTSRILGTAALYDCMYAQDFPLYGAARRGAPVMAFVRIDDRPILLRGYITKPNILMLLDESIMEVKDVFSDLPADCTIIINTTRSAGYFKDEHPEIKDMRVFCVDGTGIALEYLNKPIPNVVIIGFLIGITHLITIDAFKKAVKDELGRYPEDLIDKNIVGALKACELVRGREQRRQRDEDR